MNITDSTGYIIAELKQTKVIGLPGIGCYTLVINLDFSVNSHSVTHYLKSTHLRVEWSDNSQSIIGNCPCEQRQPMQIPCASSFTLGFRLPLSRDQMEAIEARRKGADFALDFWLFSELAVATGVGNPVADKGDIRITQSQWVNCLESMGYQKSLLLEFSLPSELESSSALHSLVTKARAHFLNGRYNECVSECRKILESTPLSNADSNALGTARKKFSEMNRNAQDNRESMSSKERLLVLRDAINHSANYPHHHREEGTEYSRHEARIIFYSVLSVLPVAHLGV